MRVAFATLKRSGLPARVVAAMVSLRSSTGLEKNGFGLNERRIVYPSPSCRPTAQRNALTFARV
jgi:hypothetical protein